MYSDVFLVYSSSSEWRTCIEVDSRCEWHKRGIDVLQLPGCFGLPLSRECLSIVSAAYGTHRLINSAADDMCYLIFSVTTADRSRLDLNYLYMS
jgi:hypothetical protein